MLRNTSRVLSEVIPRGGGALRGAGRNQFASFSTMSSPLMKSSGQMAPSGKAAQFLDIPGMKFKNEKFGHDGPQAKFDTAGPNSGWGILGKIFTFLLGGSLTAGAFSVTVAALDDAKVQTGVDGIADRVSPTPELAADFKNFYKSFVQVLKPFCAQTAVIDAVMKADNAHSAIQTSGENEKLAASLQAVGLLFQAKGLIFSLLCKNAATRIAGLGEVAEAAGALCKVTDWENCHEWETAKVAAVMTNVSKVAVGLTKVSTGYSSAALDAAPNMIGSLEAGAKHGPSPSEETTRTLSMLP